MSEPRLISPLLDEYIMGSAVSEHHGVRCCPAMKNGTEEKYIIKVISLPASETQLNAMLLTGAYASQDDALAYYKQLADDAVQEAEILQALSEQEGFIPYLGWQVAPMPDGKGYEVYLLSSYRRTLQKHFKRESLTHLDALNLGLDLCAALAVCRRSGYLHVDLKPENIFVTEQRQYRIGDLGFVPISGLKFASLPEKYISEYTPPEISDAYATLNTTMDIYAAGLILYQAYNNGQLPFTSDIRPGDAIPAPMYADYEMSEIILKACAVSPEERWQDPMQMGQAIVSYMQRNGAMDTPIVPPPPATEVSAEDTISEDNTPPTHKDTSEWEAEDSDELTPLLVEEQETEEDDEILEEVLEDYETITDEVSEILTQADELAALEVPEPVVVPDHVDIPMPEPIDPEPSDAEESEEVPAAGEEPAEALPAENEEAEEPDLVFDDEEEELPKKKHWIPAVIAAILLALVVAGGWFFYQNYYLLHIEDIRVEGNEDSLTVYVTSDVDETMLRVLCIDTYGNQIPASVENGKAVFTRLVPNSAYSIKLTANGFHKLVGDTATAYSTPVQTNIIQFEAITGMTDGSAILRFTVEGPECDVWTVKYVTDGEDPRTATFHDHTATLTDLTVGKTYTFTLVPGKDLFITGQDEITFTARKLVKAENLQVITCANNTLSVAWQAQEGAEVASWTVRCFNDTFNETVTVTACEATFTGLDHTASYTVEVTANGMRISSSLNIHANTVTVSNLKTDTSDLTKLSLSWETSLAVPADGWVLCYSIAGMDAVMELPCSQNAATITQIIPNAAYKLWLEDTSGNLLLHSETEVKTGAPTDFTDAFAGVDIKRSDLEFVMCKTPAKPNWVLDDLKDEDYTTTFAAGQGASFVVYLHKDTTISTNKALTTIYIIRNADGTPLYTATKSGVWNDMWYRNCCKLSIPILPSTAGNYIVEVYFNGGLAGSQSFTVT